MSDQRGEYLLGKRFPDATLFFVTPQDNVLNIITQIMDECIPNDRANRDFSVKFPEEIRHDNLAGQLWFGAEVVYYHQTSPWKKTGTLPGVHVSTLSI